MGRFNDIEDISPMLTMKLPLQSGAEMPALPTVLKGLKSRHHIDLTNLGNVKWTPQ
jgi:hypothetical protein